MQTTQTTQPAASREHLDIRDHLEVLKDRLQEVFRASCKPVDGTYMDSFPEIRDAIAAITAALGIEYDYQTTSTFSITVKEGDDFGIYINGPGLVMSNGLPAIFWAGKTVPLDPNTPLISDAFAFQKESKEESGTLFYDRMGYCWPFRALMSSENAKSIDMLRVSNLGGLAPYLYDFTPMNSLRDLPGGEIITIHSRSQKEGKKGSYSVIECHGESSGAFMAYDPLSPEDYALFNLPAVGQIAEDSKGIQIEVLTGGAQVFAFKGGFSFTQLKKLTPGQSYQVIAVDMAEGNPKGEEAWMREPKPQLTIIVDGKEQKADAKGKRWERRLAELPSFDVVTPETPATLKIVGISTKGKGSVTWEFHHESINDNRPGIAALKAVAAQFGASAPPKPPAAVMAASGPVPSGGLVIPAPTAAVAATAPAAPAPVAAPAPAPAPAPVAVAAPAPAPVAVAAPAPAPVAVAAPAAGLVPLPAPTPAAVPAAAAPVNLVV